MQVLILEQVLELILEQALMQELILEQVPELILVQL